MLTMPSIRKYSDNEFYFVTGYRTDSCTSIGNVVIRSTHPAIGRMDSLGNISTLYHFILNTSECYNMPGDLEVLSDRGVVTWGGENRFFAVKADSSGAPVWAKRFNNNGGFQFIKELPSGDLLAGINMDTAGAVVARLDSDGNFIWCRSYIHPNGMINDVLIESDDIFVITGYTDSIASPNSPPPDYHPKLFMMKLNGTGEMQWCRGYDSEHNWNVNRSSRIVRSADDNYVVLANIRTPEQRPFLMKTDQNGDTLWTRSAGHAGYEYTTSDLLPYSDGGFLYNGMIYGELPDNWTGAPYLYKTDSLGKLPCSEHWYPVQVLDLFPTDSSFTLTSIDGATVHPAFVNDTIFAPINVYDACIVTNVQNPMLNQARKVNIRPNPNTGQFTMEFADPLLRESYYSVYDTLGKLLFQRPLPSGATLEEVDLSRFGRGTYVVKVTDPEGTRHERVVLE